MEQPIKNTYPPDLTVGTSMFFIEHQHVAGVKSPLLRIIEYTKQVQDGKLWTLQQQLIKISVNYNSRKMEEIQVELMSITGQKVLFVSTGLVALIFMFRKF